MKKFTFSLFAIVCLSLVSIGGCGHKAKVIEAPAVDEPEKSASEQEDYDKQMEEQMKNQGN